MRNILEAVGYLHSSGVAHLDLKLENFFLDSEYRVKLGDFGLARDTSPCNVTCGTPGYIAPEMLEGEESCPMKADVFSLGVVLFIMVLNKVPFTEARPQNANFKALLKGKWGRFWAFMTRTREEGTEFLGEPLMELLEGMLNPDPDD